MEKSIDSQGFLKWPLRIVLDFDGVIHNMTNFVKSDVIDGEPVAGAFDAIREYIRAGYRVAIYSGRSSMSGARKAMKEWMLNAGLEPQVVEHLDFPDQKPNGEIYIDDKAFEFKGEFPSVEFIKSFKPWNRTDGKFVRYNEENPSGKVMFVESPTGKPMPHYSVPRYYKDGEKVGEVAMTDSEVARVYAMCGIGGAPTRATTLPQTASDRKTFPVASGVLDYFPDALAAIAHVSWKGNNQHNPDKPLHWDRSKSGDEADTMLRHFLQRGSNDTDGIRHSAKMAWRALALLQKEIEAGK